MNNFVAWDNVQINGFATLDEANRYAERVCMKLCPEKEYVIR